MSDFETFLANFGERLKAELNFRELRKGEVRRIYPTASLSASVRCYPAEARKGALWSPQMGPLTQPSAVGARL